MRLQDRVAMVTGAGGGIGRATALRLAAEGARVVALDWSEQAAAETAREMREAGGRALGVVADVSSRADVQAAVDRALAEFGRLDILVNNAAINRDAMMYKMTDEQFDQVVAINLKGSWLCAQIASVPMVQQKWGRIINTSSVGIRGNIGQTNYAAAKAGIVGLTRTMALELARYGITVNAVAPGCTDTAMTAGMPPHIKEATLKAIPLGRIAQPSDIAGVHAFLASDDAAYITGQLLWCDGGFSIGLL